MGNVQTCIVDDLLIPFVGIDLIFQCLLIMELLFFKNRKEVLGIDDVLERNKTTFESKFFFFLNNGT